MRFLIKSVVSRSIASPPPPNEQTNIFSLGFEFSRTFVNINNGCVDPVSPTFRAKLSTTFSGSIPQILEIVCGTRGKIHGSINLFISEAFISFSSSKLLINLGIIFKYPSSLIHLSSQL